MNFNTNKKILRGTEPVICPRGVKFRRKRGPSSSFRFVRRAIGLF